MDLETNLEYELGYEFLLMNQKKFKDYIYYYSKDFPMVCYEYTPDSPYEVNISESIFLNDENHDFDWIVCCKNDEPICVMCLKDRSVSDEVEIDVLEVSLKYRKECVAGNVLDVLERYANKNYKRLCITPFDTSAMNFWKHNGYVQDNEFEGYFKKNIEYEY